jgi:hypothetical protein
MTPERRRLARGVPHSTALRDARIRAGKEARIIDCSPAGVRLASLMRLMPGRRCTVTWPGVEGAPSASGVIVRSCVGRLDTQSGIEYQAAIGFDGEALFLREAATQSG